MGPIFSLTAKKRDFHCRDEEKPHILSSQERRLRPRAQLLGHLAGQCLGLLHLSLHTVGGNSKTCNDNRATSTSPLQ